MGRIKCHYIYWSVALGSLEHKPVVLMKTVRKTSAKIPNLMHSLALKIFNERPETECT